MKIETAKKIFKDRAENFYDKTVAWLVDEMDRCFKEAGYVDESQKVTQAYKVLKKAEVI